MKRFVSCNLLFLLVVFAVSCATPAKQENYGKTKQNSSNAFAELEGKEPLSEPNGENEQNGGGKPAFDDLENEDFDLVKAVLKGTGIGEDEKTAKADALAQLGSSIVANVSSHLFMSQEENDGNYSESLKNDVVIRSDVFLKGVKFTKPARKDENVYVTAFMTQESIINTIAYLLETMPEDIDTLSPEKFDDVLTMIYLSYSLLYAVTDSQIPERGKYIEMLGSLKKEIETAATHGSVYFSAESGAKGNVEIAGGSFELNKKIFLKPGNYKFSVKLDGYKNLSGSFQLSKGDKKFVEIFLVPENPERHEVFLKVASQLPIAEDIDKAMLDFGIVPTQKEELPHQIAVVVKTASVKVDSYERYTISVDISTFRNGEKFKVAHYEHKPFFVTAQNRSEKVKEESRKISSAVVKKFLSSIDLKEFFGEPE